MACKGCAYAVSLTGEWYCDYLLLTGRRRPCPPGKSCTVRKEADLTKKGSTYMKQRKWDTEKALALYSQKLTDAENAAQVGATASAVSYWRRGRKLPANPESRSAPKAEAPSKRPSVSPEAVGPAALSVEWNGCAFSLRAPDLESAALIYEYAGRLLADLRAVTIPDSQEGGRLCES